MSLNAASHPQSYWEDAGRRIAQMRESRGRTGMVVDGLWSELRGSADKIESGDPFLSRLLGKIIFQSANFADALASRIATLLTDDLLEGQNVVELVKRVLLERTEILDSCCADLAAIRRNDPATDDLLSPFLFCKGFSGLATQRVAHHLWCENRRTVARYLQHRVSIVTGLDLHPAAQFGDGILLDHATGIVVGETARVADDVIMFHNVTLGSTGKERGDRHPKVGRRVLIGAGATLLGRIAIGDGARIAAGSVVLRDIPAYSVAAGVPARIAKIRDPRVDAVPSDGTMLAGRPQLWRS